MNAYVCSKYLIPGKVTGTLSICSGRTWVAVKELNLSHYIGETLLITIYPLC